MTIWYILGEPVAVGRSHLFLFDAGQNPHLLYIIMSNWSGTCVVHCVLSYRLYALQWKMTWTILFSVSLKRSRLQNYIRIWMILWVPWFFFLSFSCIPKVQLWVTSQKPKNKIFSNITCDNDLVMLIFPSSGSLSFTYNHVYDRFTW